MLALVVISEKGLEAMIFNKNEEIIKKTKKIFLASCCD